MNTNTTVLYLLNDALNDNDNINKYNNMHDNYEHNYDNFYYLKNKIIAYLNKKKNKLYNKLSLCFDDNNYDKKLYIEYINEIYYMNQDILKEINKITFEDNFEYKYNFEIKNNIRNKYKLIYNNIKLRL